MSQEETIGTSEYFSFTLGEEEFALEITKVREVLDYTTIFKIPRMPEFIRGVINLRGDVVPVVDLRLKLGMSAIEKTLNTCIVIVEVGMQEETVLMGVLVDSVQEVFTLDAVQIKPAPKLGTKLNTEFIRGMGKRDEKFLILLDINRVFTSKELEMVSQTTEENGVHT
ncbi:MAG TPA: chemotaxis protein CheW [Cyanobacteria bacterium UBA8530]|nr:chemotaxis protein CheW [Cyanobacteria bacterium UBA8530]